MSIEEQEKELDVVKYGFADGVVSVVGGKGLSYLHLLDFKTPDTDKKIRRVLHYMNDIGLNVGSIGRVSYVCDLSSPFDLKAHSSKTYRPQKSNKKNKRNIYKM